MVYGQPAVAVAIDQRVRISVSPITDKSTYWRLDGMDFKPDRHPHLQGLKRRMWHHSVDTPPLDVKIISELPSASGLGSSAALSVAFTAALRAARGRRIDSQGWCEGFSSEMGTNPYLLPRKGVDNGFVRNGGQRLIGAAAVNEDECAIMGHAIEAEVQQGRASPIDSSTVSHGGCTLLSDDFESGIDWRYTRRLSTPEGERTWEIHEVPIKTEEVSLVIGNTGCHSSTSELVSRVASILKDRPERMNEILTIGSTARRGAAALVSGDMEKVGICMTENHLLLRGLGVSSPELENLVKAAAPSSLGVKLTGAGGGGCMIALTRNPRETAEAIELVGGRTLISSLGAPGVRIESEDGVPFWTPGVAES